MNSPVVAGFAPNTPTAPMGGGSFPSRDAFPDEPYGPPLEAPTGPPRNNAGQYQPQFNSPQGQQPQQQQQAPQAGPNGESIPALITPEEARMLEMIQRNRPTQQQAPPQGGVTNVPNQGTFAGTGLPGADQIPTELTTEQYLELRRRAAEADRADVHRVNFENLQTRVEQETELARQMAALQQREQQFGLTRFGLFQNALQQVRNGADPEQVLAGYFQGESQMHAGRFQQYMQLDQYYRDQYTNAVQKVSAPDLAAFVAEEQGLPEHYVDKIMTFSGGDINRMEEVANALKPDWEQERMTLSAFDQIRRELAAGAIATSGANRPPLAATTSGSNAGPKPGTVEQYNALPWQSMGSWFGG